MSTAQPKVNDSSFVVHPLFQLGEQKKYLVKEFIKIESSPIFPVHSNQDFRMVIDVLDTSGGFTLGYTFTTIEASNKRMKPHTIKAKSINGLKVLIHINKNGVITGFANVQQIKEQLNAALDKYTLDKAYRKNEEVAIKHLRLLLQTPNGYLSFIEPVLLFHQIYDKPIRTQKDFKPETKENLIGNTRFHGVMAIQLKEVDMHKGLATVNMEYTGNQEQVAKLVAPLAQQQLTELKGKEYKKENLPMIGKMKTSYVYNIIVSTGWPDHIYTKDVSMYIGKTTTKTTISLLASN